MNYLRERKKILLFAVVVMLITTIPYLIGYGLENDEWVFTGFIIGVQDGNSYIAKMLTGSAGKWLFKTPYTAMEQNGVIAYLPFILLGKLAAGEAVHTQLVVLYHTFRILAGILYVLAGYDFLSIFIKSDKWRWRGIVFYALGGGGGWVLVILGQKNLLGSLPLDFISPESFGFLSIFGFPHLAAGRAFLLWSFVTYLKKGSGYMAGLYLLILGLFQPIYMGVAWGLIITHLIIMFIISKSSLNIKARFDPSLLKEDAQNIMRIVLISSPLMIYTAIVFLWDPFLRKWTGQNMLPSPHIVHYIIAYGIFIPLAILGTIRASKDSPRRSFFIAGWLLIFPLLVSFPISIQRRLAEGIWAAISVGIFIYLENLERIPKMINGLLWFAYPTTMMILAGSIFTVISPSTPIYRPKSEIGLYKALSGFAEIDSVVLSSYEIGNNLPAWAPLRVVLGHGPETINFEATQSDVISFYQPSTSDQARERILNQFKVDFVIAGPIENDLAGWNPDYRTLLNLIYENDGYAIYVPVVAP